MPLDLSAADDALKPLFEPLKLGAVETPNRVFMAPLTRNRAADDGTPWDHAATYYSQRAGAGLIITEATQVSPQGKGYIKTPGVHSDAQERAWGRIVDAVHAAGGRIFLQLWHVGRISHTSIQEGGAAPVAPSAIHADAQTFTYKGFERVSPPRALETDEIPGVVDQFRQGARRAAEAGFDGVEVHAANGYLIDQFLQDKTNRREDGYGGSAQNRARFLFEVIDAVTGEIDPGRVGVRLAPTGTFGDIDDSDRATTFGTAIEGLSGRGLAYLHFVEKFASDPDEADMKLLGELRRLFDGPFVGNGAYSAEEAAQRIAAGEVDAVAWGKKFIANPDLPRRFALGAELNRWDDSTFYGGDERGYTDYPFLED